MIVNTDTLEAPGYVSCLDFEATAKGKEGERESLGPSSRGGAGSQVGMSCLTVAVFLVHAGVAGERDRGGNGIRGDHIGKGEQTPPPKVSLLPVCASLRAHVFQVASLLTLSLPALVTVPQFILLPTCLTTSGQ